MSAYARAIPLVQLVCDQFHDSVPGGGRHGQQLAALPDPDNAHGLVFIVVRQFGHGGAQVPGQASGEHAKEHMGPGAVLRVMAHGGEAVVERARKLGDPGEETAERRLGSHQREHT